MGDQSVGGNDALHLKYRPSTLDEVIGNDAVIEVLRRQLHGESAQPVSHSMIFTGPTGCGKTTLARIVARTLGIVGTDLREVDSADFRGIDTIREMRQQSMYRPLEGPRRAWIMDEAHRLTSDAQSALLKILEDTPPHVYFLLCTTDPQKLLPTILGRCAQFQVCPLSEREMTTLLRRIVHSEGETISREVHKQIVQDSLGRPRDALQILAQALSVSSERRLEVAKRAAEVQSEVIELCRCLTNATTPWKRVATILQGLKEEDPEKIRRAVLGYCQSVLLNDRSDLAAKVMAEFMEPFYNSGRPGLVLACYSVLFAE